MLLLISSMFQSRNCVVPSLFACLLGALIVLAPPPLKAHGAGIVPVVIYGDGNPSNGIEDNRKPLVAERARGVGPGDNHMSAGTIKCDGKFRGTAIVVDTREYAPDLPGVVLVSAAHVLFDLEKEKLFRRCWFQFMGWEGTAYRSKINLKDVRMGHFDPGQATGDPTFGEGDWAFLYLRRPWKKFNPDQSLRLRDFSFTQAEAYRQSGGEFRLLAFDTKAGVISQSMDCTVVESESDDIGGGSWHGQLLDDCDSGDGASGGGIVAVLDQVRFLIGIRTGSHWSNTVYPVDSYPSGPPAGSTWNRHSNSNFGRAIDSYLQHEIKLFIQMLTYKYTL